MPVDPSAAIEITAFADVPDFAKGLVRDLRVRWALEEAGLDYRERLLDAGGRPDSYIKEQPFAQVPVYRDGSVEIFESGAIVLHIATSSEALMPKDREGAARAATWVLAALDSVEKAIDPLVDIDLFHAGEDWAKARRPAAEQHLRKRLSQLSDWLGTKEYLEDRFTVGDLMMTTVLRNLRHTGLVAEHANLDAYKTRCEARPAFRRALDAQLAAFGRNARAA